MNQVNLYHTEEASVDGTSSISAEVMNVRWIWQCNVTFVEATVVCSNCIISPKNYLMCGIAVTIEHTYCIISV